MSMEIEDNYTKDGTTDIHGNPADKRNTGNWRTCPYILGIPKYHNSNFNFFLFFLM